MERRPIASRELAISKAVAHWLAQRGATPNGISVAGMVAGVLTGVCLALTRYPSFQIAGFLLAAALIQCRLLANMFDGMVAIATGKTSPVGELYNEIPDRVSDAATLAGAGYALGGIPELGYWAAILALLIAYIRAQGRVAGGPQEYCGPMAKQQRMFVIFLACLICAFWPEWKLPAGSVMSSIGTLTVALGLILVGEVITVARRLNRIAGALKRAS